MQYKKTLVQRTVKCAQTILVYRAWCSCIRIRARQGRYGQIYPFAWGSSWGGEGLSEGTLKSKGLYFIVTSQCSGERECVSDAGWVEASGGRTNTELATINTWQLGRRREEESKGKQRKKKRQFWYILLPSCLYWFWLEYFPLTLNILATAPLDWDQPSPSSSCPYLQIPSSLIPPETASRNKAGRTSRHC